MTFEEFNKIETTENEQLIVQACSVLGINPLHVIDSEEQTIKAIRLYKAKLDIAEILNPQWESQLKKISRGA